jgi:gas vesicle protein
MRALLISGTLIGALIASTVLYASSNSESTKGCEIKTQHLQQALVEAKTMGNSERVQGLKIALAKVSNYCTDSTLSVKIENKLMSKEENLNEYIEDYNEAINHGKEDKMQKYETKIIKVRAEIFELKEALKELV